MAWRTYREPRTLGDALEPCGHGRIVDLDRVPYVHDGWWLRIGHVRVGSLVKAAGVWSAWSMDGTRTSVTGDRRDATVREFVRQLAGVP